MATITASVSFPAELGVFLEENPEISLSKIVQTKLYEMKNDANSIRGRLKALEIKLFRATGKLQSVLDYCEKQGVIIPADVLE